MDEHSFVSRGGIKLQHALSNWGLEVRDLVALDVGASTGGFTDCLLQNDVKQVYSVDTAYGEFAWKLRQDPRVVVMERTNILHLDKLSETVDLIVIDAGWTKLELVLPVVKEFLKKNGIIIALLKPHYETDAKNLRKGVVLPELVEEVKNQVINNIESLGFKVEKVIESPILGSNGKGNKEYLILITC